jgi:hypothetical protein
MQINRQQKEKQTLPAEAVIKSGAEPKAHKTAAIIPIAEEAKIQSAAVFPPAVVIISPDWAAAQVLRTAAITPLAAAKAADLRITVLLAAEAVFSQIADARTTDANQLLPAEVRIMIDLRAQSNKPEITKVKPYKEKV